MNDEPVLLLILIAVGFYVLNQWRQDYQAARRGAPNPGALPGVTPTSLKACVIAGSGALIILALETYGEIHLGLSEQQSHITLLFAAYTLMAAFLEELTFRGFLVIDNKGTGLRWAGIIGASVIFAAIHPFLWSWENNSFTWTFTPKGIFSTTVVFISSLWFYTVRFVWFNATRSLIPCIVAHASKNLGVIIIKAACGFVAGWW
jgi:uncharacterized protein